MQLKMGAKNWGRNLNTEGKICLFCNLTCNSDNSFKHINIENGSDDIFHAKCFRTAVDSMIINTKKKNMLG